MDLWRLGCVEGVGCYIIYNFYLFLVGKIEMRNMLSFMKYK